MVRQCGGEVVTVVVGEVYVIGPIGVSPATHPPTGISPSTHVFRHGWAVVVVVVEVDVLWLAVSGVVWC